MSTPPGSSEADSGDQLLGGPGRRAAYKALRENPRFRNLFWAMMTSSLGDWIGVFAILSLTEMIEGTGRDAAFALAGVMMARVLPTLLIGPVAGVFADRWDRKRTMIVTDIGRAVLMFAIAFSADAFQLFVGTFFIEVLSMLFIPAKDATIPNLVEEENLVQANQLSLIVTYGTLPIGAGLFAVFSAISGALFADGFLGDRPQVLAIWANALTFVVSAWFIQQIQLEESARLQERRAAENEKSAFAELKEGLEFVATHPFVRALVVGVMAAFLAAGVVFAVGPLFVREVNAGTAGFGILGAVVGVGLLGGLLAAGPLTERLHKERLFAPGIALAGLSLVLTAFAPRLDLAAIPAFTMGAGAGLAFIVGYTMLQEHSDDELRGRTFAAFNTGARVALFLSLVVGPGLVGALGRAQPGPDGIYGYQIDGVRITLMLAGLVAFGGAIWTGRSIYMALVEKRRRNRDEALISADEPPTRRGLFIVFEGGEGSGKSTQIRMLTEALERIGREVIVSREPGGTPLGERLREVVLDRTADINPRAEALLYAAARAQHAEDVIRPALDREVIVLCDRFVDSSIVYQGTGRHLGADAVAELNRWGTGGLRPDLTVLLDVDAETGLHRALDGEGARGGDRIEAAGVEFHRAVNHAFRALAAAQPEEYVVVDAARPPEQVHHEVLFRVLERLPEERPRLEEAPSEDEWEDTRVLPEDEIVTRQVSRQPDP